MNANSMNPEEPGTPGAAGATGSSATNGASAGAPGTSSDQPSAGGSAGAGPAAGSYAPSGEAPQGSQQNFFDWTRNLGIRRGPDRWIGGVASGIAHRFGIDPLIVRGIFIVLALFAGIGVLLYGVAWALLPEPDGRIHVQEAAAGRWSGGMTGALITTIIGFPSLGRGFWGWGGNGLPGVFWTLFWIAGVSYLVYVLVQRNKGAKASQSRGPQNYTATYSATPTAGTNTGVPVYGASGYGAGPTPPSGPRPPYGSTPPQEWAPKPTAPKRKGPGAAMIAVSAGAALLAGGTLKALDAGHVIDLGTSANAVVWATGAALLGLGIVVAGLRGRTSGFLGFLAIVALIIGGIFNVVPRNGDRFTFHDVNWAPTSVEQARQGIDVTGAQGTVDLSDITTTPPLITEVLVPVDATASNVTVIIPDNVPVEVRADMTFGNLNERGSDRGGRLKDDRTLYNTGKPGANLVVQIDGTFSNVTIKEGN
ncbi:PspC domain-containing protein [Paenarthrobacter nicotinovorans]|uniref:PspC domain-containing protein n=1 Tax=Paenarthrobacter nicotinovorans TaxID=29320 RepID=UPI003814A9C3